jgi:hypothetical protein
MIKEIPLFPLNIVVFPKEELNLHIFEPRYKELINDCLETKTTFGIPSFVMTKLEIGTEVKITEVTKRYDDGRLDIKTVGLRSFKVLNFEDLWNGKQHGGGEVELIETVPDASPQQRFQFYELSQELFKWLQIDKEICLDGEDPLYSVIHKMGLKPEEEYQLLKMNCESDRYEYVIEHLNRLIPALERAEKAKEKIQMNGHFKHFDPLNF